MSQHQKKKKSFECNNNTIIFLYRVDFEDGDGKVVVGNSVAGNTLTEIPKADTEDLVYLQESPNYCQANNTTGKRNH